MICSALATSSVLCIQWPAGARSRTPSPAHRGGKPLGARQVANCNSLLARLQFVCSAVRLRDSTSTAVKELRLVNASSRGACAPLACNAPHAPPPRSLPHSSCRAASSSEDQHGTKYT
ncbi:hypothetical protein DMC30DRAFT_403490 [Rhodotorula diobovata]|uniref:Uncharacterized protein n=1 Tax=Rhodotorula diobovata TaxID=5288 RepID=A0A5C5FPR0_9BASI|nr:hypothetical protein DMC30DRAFT_403490 [Rhodotorula diobovata]